MPAVNWASVEEGAEIVEVSHEASHVISSANNVLIDREDMLWISGTLPQHIVLRVAPNHPPIRYLGWYAWQHYLTNPKVVEISSGVVEGCLSPIIVCTGLPGAGKQLWELEEPIPASHTFISFRVTATFGASSTYMNRIYLYSEHPGEGFSAPTSEGQENVTSGGAGGLSSPSKHQMGPSPLKMTGMLKELDDEIRMLHPLRNISPSRGTTTHLHTSAANISGQPADSSFVNPNNVSGGSYQQQPQQPYFPPPNMSASNSPQNMRSVSGGGGGGYGGGGAAATISAAADPNVIDLRLQTLEGNMHNLMQLIQSQRQEMSEVRGMLLAAQLGGNNASKAQGQTSGNQPQPQNVSTTAASTHQHHPFPESALRHCVEEVMAPRLDKYRHRIETRVLQRVDEAVHGIEKDVKRSVNDKVRRYIYDIATHEEHPFHSRFAVEDRSAGEAPTRQCGQVEDEVPSSHRRIKDKDSARQVRQEDVNRPAKKKSSLKQQGPADGSSYDDEVRHYERQERLRPTTANSKYYPPPEQQNHSCQQVPRSSKGKVRSALLPNHEGFGDDLRYRPQ